MLVVLYVCRYSPPGNVKGKFADNVAPRRGDHRRGLLKI
jgi:hypothetical protein